jgi:hypothetical protein
MDRSNIAQPKPVKGLKENWRELAFAYISVNPSEIFTPEELYFMAKLNDATPISTEYCCLFLKAFLISKGYEGHRTQYKNSGIRKVYGRNALGWPHKPSWVKLKRDKKLQPPQLKKPTLNTTLSNLPTIFA